MAIIPYFTSLFHFFYSDPNIKTLTNKGLVFFLNQRVELMSGFVIFPFTPLSFIPLLLVKLKEVKANGCKSVTDSPNLFEYIFTSDNQG